MLIESSEDLSVSNISITVLPLNSIAVGYHEGSESRIKLLNLRIATTFIKDTPLHYLANTRCLSASNNNTYAISNSPNTTGVSSGNGSRIAISLWTKLTNARNVPLIPILSIGGEYWMSINFSNSNDIQVILFHENTIIDTLSVVPSFNVFEWNHYVLSIDEKTIAIYGNGIYLSSKEFHQDANMLSPDLSASPWTVTIGSIPPSYVSGSQDYNLSDNFTILIESVCTFTNVNVAAIDNVFALKFYNNGSPILTTEAVLGTLPTDGTILLLDHWDFEHLDITNSPVWRSKQYSSQIDLVNTTSSSHNTIVHSPPPETLVISSGSRFIRHL